MDAGPEAIGDPGELDRVRRQARSVHRKAAATAAILTLLALAVPA